MADTTAAGLPLPGYAIPYAFTAADIQNFISTYAGDPVVSQYMYTKQPPYGVIWNNPAGVGQLLLWFDASGVFHIVDVTNMSIATQVQQAPYESPDSGILSNLLTSVQNFIQSLPSPTQALNFAELAVLALALYFLAQIAR